MGSRYAKRASQNGWESRTNRRARGNIRSFVEVSRDRRLFEMTWAIGSRRRDVKVHSYHAIVRLCHACRSATPGRLQVHLELDACRIRVRGQRTPRQRRFGGA